MKLLDRLSADRKYKFQTENPNTQSRLICASHLRAMHRIQAANSTRGASIPERHLCLGLHVGGSGIPQPYGKTYEKAKAKYQGSNWSSTRLPVCMTRLFSTSACAVVCEAIASNADTCWALTSPKPALVRSPTTAFGLHMVANSCWSWSSVMLSRYGVAAFWRWMSCRLLSSGNKAMISVGTPSSGKVAARWYTSDSSKLR